MEKFCHKTIHILLTMIMFLTVGLCLFGNSAEYVCKKEFMLPTVVYACAGGVLLIAIAFAAQHLGKYLQRTKWSDFIMMGLSLAFFGFLVVLTYHYYFRTGWDAQVVHWAAEMVVESEINRMPYFSYYPNNAFIVFLFSVAIRIGRLARISNGYFCIVTMQCFLFAVTAFVLYRTAVLLANERVALAVWVVYVMIPGLSPWVTVPYSDATGLLFPALLFYLYVYICKKKKYTMPVLAMGGLACIGYYIKPQIIIVIIAVLMTTAFSFRKKWLSEKSRLWKIALLAVGGLIGGYCLVTLAVNATNMEINKEMSMGMPHYLMLGLNEEYGGMINIVDQEFSRTFDTSKERNAANLEVAFERIREMGPGGMLRLWKNKTLTNFSDGTFARWEEGEFFADQMYEGNPTIRAYLSSYFYEGGSLYELFKGNSQLLWMGLLLLMCVGLVVRVAGKDVRREETVLKLSLIGIIVFELLFEARARYLFIYVPLMILLTCHNIGWVTDKCKAFAAKKRKKKESGKSR